MKDPKDKERQKMDHLSSLISSRAPCEIHRHRIVRHAFFTWEYEKEESERPSVTIVWK